MTTLTFDSITRSQGSDGATWRQRLGRWFLNVQYGRLVQAMNSMSDQQLQQIGVKRADIPTYAREALQP